MEVIKIGNFWQYTSIIKPWPQMLPLFANLGISTSFAGMEPPPIIHAEVLLPLLLSKNEFRSGAEPITILSQENKNEDDYGHFADAHTHMPTRESRTAPANSTFSFRNFVNKAAKDDKALGAGAYGNAVKTSGITGPGDMYSL